METHATKLTFVCSSLLLAASITSAPVQSQANQDGPNIILILTDDLDMKRLAPMVQLRTERRRSIAYRHAVRECLRASALHAYARRIDDGGNTIFATTLASASSGGGEKTFGNMSRDAGYKRAWWANGSLPNATFRRHTTGNAGTGMAAEQKAASVHGLRRRVYRPR